jgi:pimeloyl-ACP methyl ester carboxylesterase
VALEVIASNLIAINAHSNWAFCLIHTSSRPETADGKLAREKTIAAIERDFERVIQGIATFGVHSSHRADVGLMAETLSIMRDAGTQVAVRQLRAIMARADHRPLLSQIKARTLVISSRDDAVVPPAASEEMADRIAGAQLAWVAPAGHMSPLEQPAQLATLLKSLL